MRKVTDAKFSKVATFSMRNFIEKIRAADMFGLQINFTYEYE